MLFSFILGKFFTWVTNIIEMIKTNVAKTKIIKKALLINLEQIKPAVAIPTACKNLNTDILLEWAFIAIFCGNELYAYA